MSSEHRHPGHSGPPEAQPTGPSIGLVLALIGSVATLWLAATGQLGLYIHPRYFTFTTVVVGLGLVATIAAYVIAGRQPAEHDDHDHEEVAGWRRRLQDGGRILAAIALVVGLLVMPPATLTTSTVEQRSLNSSAEADIQLLGGDPSNFQLRDWAAVLSRHSTAVNYAGQELTLSGFVTQARSRNPDIFYLARFVVVCCTVDARPVGVPVAVANWEKSHKIDTWVQVTGTLVITDATTPGGVVLKPTSIKAIERPDQPYDF